MGYVGDSAPEKLSLTRAEPLVSYVGDRLQGAPGNTHYAWPKIGWIYKENPYIPTARARLACANSLGQSAHNQRAELSLSFWRIMCTPPENSFAQARNP